MTLTTWHTDNNFDKFFDMEPLFVTKNSDWFNNEETLLPRVNLIENENSFYLEAETPGMMEKDINVEVHNGVLTIKGHKEKHGGTKNKHYRIREFSNQGFERNFKLSDRVNTEQVSAKVENGVLKVDLPIHEQVKPQKIEVTGIA